MCVYAEGPRDEARENSFSEPVPHRDPLDGATVPAAEVASMVLDALGTVRDCSGAAARLFGAGAHQLIGRPVRELIPDVPLSAETPGYNVAYAAFWAAEAPGHEFRALDSRGRPFCVMVSLEELALEGRHQILVCLRQAAGASADARADLEAASGFPREKAGWRIAPRSQPQFRSPAAPRAC